MLLLSIVFVAWARCNLLVRSTSNKNVQHRLGHIPCRYWSIQCATEAGTHWTIVIHDTRYIWWTKERKKERQRMIVLSLWPLSSSHIQLLGIFFAFKKHSFSAPFCCELIWKYFTWTWIQTEKKTERKKEIMKENVFVRCGKIVAIDETPPHFAAGLPYLHKFTWSQLSIVAVSVEIGRSVFVFRFFLLLLLRYSNNVICLRFLLLLGERERCIELRPSTKPLYVIIIIIELGIDSMLQCCRRRRSNNKIMHE